MTVIQRVHRTVAVYPGLFFLANVTPISPGLPHDLVDDLLDRGEICRFGPGGITFVSAFQSHIVTANVEFLAHPSEVPAPVDTPQVRTRSGTFAFTGDKMQFENPDYTQPETQFPVPVSGQHDVVVTRRLLVSPSSFTPPPDDPNPTGLEHWTITVLPGHSG